MIEQCKCQDISHEDLDFNLQSKSHGFRRFLSHNVKDMNELFDHREAVLKSECFEVAVQ